MQLRTNFSLITQTLTQNTYSLGATLDKKWSFPLKISSVNVTKSAVSCGFDHIYWKNP